MPDSRTILCVIAALLLTACATGYEHSLRLSDYPTQTTRPSDDSTRAQLMALRDDLYISYYGAGPCDMEPVDEPDSQIIEPGQLWAAIRDAQQAARKCARRHDTLRREAKAALGTVRQRIDAILRRHE